MTMKYFATLLLFLIPSVISADPSEQAKVTIVEEEIEIEYVDTSIWGQWVFDTDTTVEYMTFNEDGTITYSYE